MALMTVTAKCRKVDSGDVLPNGDASFVTSGGQPMTLARIPETTSETELLAWLHDCSQQPHSDQRNADCDELLDLLLEWAGI